MTNHRKSIVVGGILGIVVSVVGYFALPVSAPRPASNTKQTEKTASSEPKKADPKEVLSETNTPTPRYQPKVSKVLWVQNFTKLPNGRPNPAYWNTAGPDMELYNNEKQIYHNKTENVRVEGGRLVIQAHKKDSGYTSGRVDTEGNLTIRQGTRLEARIKLPSGRGTWPAFWLLSATQPHTAKFNPDEEMWQQEKFYRWDGEIDIVEGYGAHPGIAEATVYTYDNLKEGQTPVNDYDEAYHTYWLEWRADKLMFGVDGKVYHTYTKPSDSVSKWPFTPENKFFVILNLAMGGDGGGQIVKKSGDSWTMRVAWLKYYELR